MKDESDAWLDIEGKSLARANAETVAKLDGKEKLSDWNGWVAKDLAQDDWVVESQAVQSHRTNLANCLKFAHKLKTQRRELKGTVHQARNEGDH